MAASGSTRPTLPHPSLLPGADALDPYGAFVALMPDGTGSLAPQGVLGGVSLAVKDLLVFGDRVPCCGLSSIPFHDLGPSSPVVARLVEAGASLAGFTR